MLNMKPLSLKLRRMLKLKSLTDKQINRQTGQKQYALNHSIRGHKNITYMYLVSYRPSLEVVAGS